MQRLLTGSIAVVVFLSFAFVLISGPSYAAKDPAVAQAKARDQVVKLLLSHADWCVKNGTPSAGRRALDEARGLDATAKGLEAVAKALDGKDEDTLAVDALARQRSRIAPKVGKAYEKLADAADEAKDPAATVFLVASLTWDLSAARVKSLQARIRKVGSDPDQAGRLLNGLRRADPEGTRAGHYHKLEADLATEGVLLLGSPDHGLVGYVSLPQGWKPSGSYPVLVAVDGAGSNFLGCARSFGKSRGSRDVIVLSPVTLSNTNELKPDKYPHYPAAVLEEWGTKRLEFDAPGIDALLKVLRERFGAQEKTFHTGFSGGGLYTYHRLLQHPEQVAGAAPACANFGGSGIEKAPGAGADGGPPVHLLTGELDPHRDHVFGQKPGIEGQTDRIEQELKRLRYQNVRRTQVKGAKHSSLAGQVWGFVDEVRAQ